MEIKNEIKNLVVENNNLYEFSRELIINSRKIVYQTANFQMVETCWKIGEKIVEEQGGEMYAKYGENLLKSVSARLTAEFGKGFTYVNLTNMRKFYLQFSNIYALRKELNWTHYRSLIRVENSKAREVYMNAAADNAWSTRFLDEQVDKHFYERLIASHKDAVNELNEKVKLAIKPHDYILKDPLLRDFYDLKEILQDIFMRLCVIEKFHVYLFSQIIKMSLFFYVLQRLILNELIQ
ncbi:MAG: DUF1016 N-terminal domain-containing protein [Dysgonamonadaceae bacterium]|jgi:hypothetical protein|nr:DUF1016 N-terminal domain-containing protein [Dysgonamonadaceae bacterium]